MHMMMSQTFKSVDFTKTQKSRYLKNETLFFLLMKKLINCTSRATLWEKNSFVAEVTFKYTTLGPLVGKGINFNVTM